MKLKLLVVMLLCCGCMPASQQEVLALTGLVKEVVPLIRADASERTAEVLDKIEVVNEAVATAPDPIAAVEKGWKASEPFNPYYGYGVLGLAILRMFQKKKESDNSLEEVVFGIEDAKKSGDGTKTLKASLNATESVVTRKKVAKILGKA